jgi:hypothetical protein
MAVKYTVHGFEVLSPTMECGFHQTTCTFFARSGGGLQRFCRSYGVKKKVCQVTRPNFSESDATNQLGICTYRSNLRSPPRAPTQNWCKNFTGVNHISYYLSTPRNESSQSFNCVPRQTCTNKYMHRPIHTVETWVYTHGFMRIQTWMDGGNMGIHTWICWRSLSNTQGYEQDTYEMHKYTHLTPCWRSQRYTYKGSS